MNRTQRHELAQEALRTRLEAENHLVISASTKAPCDLVSLMPGGTTVYWEVKTGPGGALAHLSRDQRRLGRSAEARGVAFVVARFRVRGTTVEWEPSLFRPFCGDQPSKAVAFPGVSA